MSNLPALIVLNLPSVYGIKNKSPWKEYSVQGNLVKFFYVHINVLVTEGEGCKTWCSFAADIYAGRAWDTFTAYVKIYRRIIICPRHSPPACLRSWAEFNFAGKSAVVGDKNIFHANLSTSVMIHRRCVGDQLEQITKCCQLQWVTTSQVGRRHMRTSLKGTLARGRGSTDRARRGPYENVILKQ